MKEYGFMNETKFKKDKICDLTLYKGICIEKTLYKDFLKQIKEFPNDF